MMLFFHPAVAHTKSTPPNHIIGTSSALNWKINRTIYLQPVHNRYNMHLFEWKILLTGTLFPASFLSVNYMNSGSAKNQRVAQIEALT